MKVDDLILDLQNLVDNARPVPLSGFEIIAQIQDAMPAEVRQAKNIVADRKQILNEANSEAENIIRAAEERKKIMLNQNELVREAQAKAKEIVDDAKAKSAEIRKAANVYADGILKRAEESLSTQLTDIKKTRSTLANSQKK